MPISREEFESGAVDRRRRILLILNQKRDQAYAADEILELINFRGSLEGAAGPLELTERMTGGPATTEEQLAETLEGLVEEKLISSVEIEGIGYYIAG